MNEFNLLDATSAPVLTFDSSWPIPQRIKELIVPARLAALKENEPLGTAPEVAAYLCTRASAAPLSSEWVEIFTHIVCCVEEKYFGRDTWSVADGKKELGRNEKDTLMRLRTWIYEKRRSILKSQMKAK